MPAHPPPIGPRFSEAAPDHHGARLADPARLAALRNSGLMDSLPDPAFDRAVRLATQITGVPVGLFSLVDTERQFFKARSGLPPDLPGEVEGRLTPGPDGLRQTPLGHSFCQYVVTGDQPLSVNDARHHPLLRANAAIADMNVIAYLGVPIHAPGGAVLGSLCAIDSRPHDWTSAHLDAMLDLAAMLETEIALRRTMADRQLILSEMNHRVKNLFTVVSGLVRISQRGQQDAAAMAQDLQARLAALSRAHDLIVPHAAIDTASGPTDVALGDLLQTVLAPYADAGDSVLGIDGPRQVVGPRSATSLALAFHELATNAAKYGALDGRHGQLSVCWAVEGNELHLVWTETATTQPVTRQKPGTGFGSQLIEMTIEGQMAGRIVTLNLPQGISREIILPLNAIRD